MNNPCSEEWDRMQTAEQGKYCAKCSKEVIDFTNFTQLDFLNYFKDINNRNGCGRFYKSQIQVLQIPLDTHIFSTEIAYWKKFLFVLLLCFGQQILGMECMLAQNTADTSFDTDSIKKINDTITTSLTKDSILLNDTSVNSKEAIVSDTIIKHDTAKIIVTTYTIDSIINIKLPVETIICGGFGMEYVKPIDINIQPFNTKAYEMIYSKNIKTTTTQKKSIKEQITPTIISNTSIVKPLQKRRKNEEKKNEDDKEKKKEDNKEKQTQTLFLHQEYIRIKKRKKEKKE